MIMALCRTEAERRREREREATRGDAAEKVEFRQHRIEILLRAEEPIAHHEGKHRQRRRDHAPDDVPPSGRKTRVPIITGDTVRHGLREAVRARRFEAAGLLDAVHGRARCGCSSRAGRWARACRR